MTEFAIDIEGGWLGGTADAADATFASLQIRAGDVPLTEVDDTLAKATRTGIRVPAVLVAEWLITHWWRLRWESRPESPGFEWRSAHSMAALDNSVPWPPLEIASDGELVEIVMAEEPVRDVAAIRYLRSTCQWVLATEFESAVERFLDLIEGRLDATVPTDRTLCELRKELKDERSDPLIAQRCRWQARAGIDPGDAAESWTAGIEAAARRVGPAATEDILAAEGPSATPDGVEAFLVNLKRATTTIDLAGVRGVAADERRGHAQPWVRGSSAARAARARLGIPAGPLSDDRLGEILGVRLPVDRPSGGSTRISGGLREDDTPGVTRVLIPSSRPVSQRFYFARLLGLAVDLPPDEPVLPVSGATTAAQKFGRAFGQEFLCPWTELDAFTQERGMDEEAIMSAAERWGVSEMLVTSTLVNRGKLDRDRLARFEM